MPILSIAFVPDKACPPLEALRYTTDSVIFRDEKRPDMINAALLRPGRFDLILEVSLRQLGKQIIISGLAFMPSYYAVRQLGKQMLVLSFAFMSNKAYPPIL